MTVTRPIVFYHQHHHQQQQQQQRQHKDENCYRLFQIHLGEE